MVTFIPVIRSSGNGGRRSFMSITPRLDEMKRGLSRHFCRYHREKNGRRLKPPRLDMQLNLKDAHLKHTSLVRSEPEEYGIKGLVLLGSPDQTQRQIQIWQKELDSIVNEFESIAADRNQTMQGWESVIADADVQRKRMYSSLQSYKAAIDRAMMEIDNIKQAAKEVLAYKAAIQKSIDKLLEYQKAV